MRRMLFLGVALLMSAVIPTGTQESRAGANRATMAGRQVSESDKQAVELAIVDEMYANNLEGYGADVSSGVSNGGYELTIYFQPTLNKDNAAWVIYKLMPYGEVYRLFAVEPNGLGVLYGRLRNHFPPTEPSYLTVYMNDDDLCRMKTEWGKSYFRVDLKPSAKRISEARARQRRRTAY